MKVKIVKCSDDDYWYKNKIGEIFEVTNYSDKHYHVVGIDRFVSMCDVVEISCNSCARGESYQTKCWGCHQNFEHKHWKYKGAEPKVENKNYIPEVCKMLGLRWDDEKQESQMFDAGDEGKYKFVRGIIFPKRIDVCVGVELFNKGLLHRILEGLVIIEPVIEFAKPIWCEHGDKYKCIDICGGTCKGTFNGLTTDYILRNIGNMFALDAVIPQAQVDQIVADMKGNKNESNI